MNRFFNAAALAAIVSVAALSLGSCGWLAEFFVELFSASGYIVDARGDDTSSLSGFDITLTSVTDGSTYTGSTSSSGYYSVGDLESGTYIIEARKDGWFVPPEEIFVGGLAGEIQDLPAYSLEVADVWGLSFITVWRNSEDNDISDDIDVDLYLSYPRIWDTANDTSFSDPYDSTLAESGSSRSEVYYGSTSHSNDYGVAARLDNDTSMFYGRGAYSSSSNPQLPETITMLDATVSDGYTTGRTLDMTMSASGADANGFRAAFEDDVTALGETSSTISWGWLGTAEVYLDAFDSESSGANLSSLYTDSTGAQQLGADAVVYVIQTVPMDDYYSKTGTLTQDHLTYTYLGAYRVPEYTDMSTASMIRINMLQDDDGYVWFQIVPDIRVVPADGLATFNPASAETTIKGVRGRQR